MVGKLLDLVPGQTMPMAGLQLKDPVMVKIMPGWLYGAAGHTVVLLKQLFSGLQLIAAPPGGVKVTENTCGGIPGAKEPICCAMAPIVTLHVFPF